MSTLYTAKRAGRDRAAIWEPTSSEDQAGLQWLGRYPRRATGRCRSSSIATSSSDGASGRTDAQRLKMCPMGEANTMRMVGPSGRGSSEIRTSMVLYPSH